MTRTLAKDPWPESQRSILALCLGTQSPRTAGLWALLGLVVYAVVRSLVYARVNTFWVDRVLLQGVCRQESLSAIWKALNQGPDGQPPRFYLIERSAAWLVPSELIEYRLSFQILGFRVHF